MATAPGRWADFFAPSTFYTGPPLTDALVAAAERAVGYALPRAYLDLLRAKNGGVPRRQCLPTRGTHWSDNHVRVVTVFGVGGLWGIDSPQFGSRHQIGQAGFPEIGVVVGWTPTAGHDAVMLDYSACGPQGEPRVTLVDAESGETQLLADTVEAFLRGLTDCRPYDEARDRAAAEFRRQSGG